MRRTKRITKTQRRALERLIVASKAVDEQRTTVLAIDHRERHAEWDAAIKELGERRADLATIAEEVVSLCDVELREILRRPTSTWSGIPELGPTA